MTGSSYNNAKNTDYATVALDAVAGRRLWVSRYNGPGRGYDDASALTLSPDRTKVFVTGTSDGGAATQNDYATVAYQN